MIIKNEKLNELIKEKGSKRVITLYINGKINLTKKQLDLVLENFEIQRKISSIIKRLNGKEVSE